MALPLALRAHSSSGFSTEEMRQKAGEIYDSDCRFVNALEAVWLWSAIESWVWNRIRVRGQGPHATEWLRDAASTGREGLRRAVNCRLPPGTKGKRSVLWRRMAAAGMDAKFRSATEDALRELAGQRHAIAHSHVTGDTQGREVTDLPEPPMIEEADLVRYRAAARECAKAADRAVDSL